jgi:hypothetical protein
MWQFASLSKTGDTPEGGTGRAALTRKEVA